MPMTVKKKLFLGFFSSSLFVMILGFIVIDHSIDVKYQIEEVHGSSIKIVEAVSTIRHNIQIINSSLKDILISIFEISYISHTYLAIEHKYIHKEDTDTYINKIILANHAINKSIAIIDDAFVVWDSVIDDAITKSTVGNVDYMRVGIEDYYQVITILIKKIADFNNIIDYEVLSTVLDHDKVWELAVKTRAFLLLNVIPLIHESQTLGLRLKDDAFVEIYNVLEVIKITADSSTSMSIIITVSAWLFALLIGLLFSISFSHPLGELTRASTEIGKGQMRTHVKVASDDEFGILAKAFNAMSTSLGYIENVLGSMTDIMIIASPSGRIKKVNRPDILNYHNNDLVDKNISELFYDSVHPDTPFFNSRRLQSLNVDRSIVNVDGLLVTRDRVMRVLISSSLMCDDKKDITGIVILAKDIEKYAKAQEELRNKDAELKAEKLSNKSKSIFLSNMSHEVRTPMNAIIGLSDLALKSTLQPRARDYLNKINNSSKSLLRIINDILDFSKIEAGKLEIQNVDFLLGDIFTSVSDIFRASASEKNVKLIMTISSECNFILNGDPLRVEQILINLVSNALKFTDEGEIEVSVKSHKDVSTLSVGDKVLLSFSVRDSGIGIKSVQLDSLFSPFTQVDDSSTRKFGGTGLGLSICKRLIAMMGGAIWVESTYSKGSTFLFNINLNWVKYNSQMVDSAKKLVGLSALIVDDNAASSRSLSQSLTFFGFAVTVVRSGEEALAAVTKYTFSLLLVDWFMPEQNGLHTVECVNKVLGSDKTKIVLLTDFSSDYDIRKRSESTHIDAYISKPVNCSQLLNTTLELFGYDAVKRHKTGSKAIDRDFLVEKLGGTQILLVEDNVINRQVATEVLEDVGVIVTTAVNGLDAFNILKDHVFDAVLMDIQMPVMDGHTATDNIRSYGIDTPVIAMTAHAMAEDHTKSTNHGMNDHITKPIDNNLLFNALLKWIPGRKRNISTIGKKKIGKSNLPEYVQGVDVNDALKRLNGNHVLLMTLIGNFIKEYGDSTELITKYTKANELQKVEELTHALKSTSGNIGAYSLAQQADSIESAACSMDVNNVNNRIEEFDNEFNQVIDSLSALTRTYRVEDVQEESAIDSTQLPFLLTTLSALIQRSDGSAQDYFDVVKKAMVGYSTGTVSTLDEVGICLDSFDFKKASQKCKLLISSIRSINE